MASHSPKEGKHWRYRRALNVSVPAYIKILKVMELLYELDMPFIVSASTTIEFMHAIMTAYHRGERLDVRNWRPETTMTRRKNTKRGHECRIEQIAKAEMGGLKYIQDKIKETERGYQTAIKAREERWKQLKRAGDEGIRRRSEQG